MTGNKEGDIYCFYYDFVYCRKMERRKWFWLQVQDMNFFLLQLLIFQLADIHVLHMFIPYVTLSKSGLLKF